MRTDALSGLYVLHEIGGAGIVAVRSSKDSRSSAGSRARVQLRNAPLELLELDSDTHVEPHVDRRTS